MKNPKIIIKDEQTIETLEDILRLRHAQAIIDKLLGLFDDCDGCGMSHIPRSIATLAFFMGILTARESMMTQARESIDSLISHFSMDSGSKEN